MTPSSISQILIGFGTGGHLVVLICRASDARYLIGPSRTVLVVNGKLAVGEREAG